MGFQRHTLATTGDIHQAETSDLHNIPRKKLLRKVKKI